MNREVLESQWLQIRDILKDKFSHLTEEDIRQINGHYDQLVAKLQQKYGYSREEAEERIKSWNFDRFASTREREVPVKEERFYREDQTLNESRVKKDETPSFFKWLLALGIPLLILAGLYYGLARTPEVSTPAPVSQERMAFTAEDQILTTNLRNNLMAQFNTVTDMQNIQITSQNGIVTLSGRVPSAEVRDSIISTAKNTTGVRQVINNLQVW